MIATKSPSPSPFPKTDPSKPEIRKPLHPKNTFTTTPSQNPKKCTQQNNTCTAQSNKENVCLLSSAAVEAVIDPSLAEELNAVKLRLERLRLDRENTAKMLEDRHRMLDFRMYELRERGEFQRELEIEVDRLFRLKQLRVACMGTSASPIQSLREKALDKRNSQVQFESAKSEDNEEKLGNKSSSSTSQSSSNMSTLESSWASISTTTSAASPSTSSSTATSKLSTMIVSRLSSDSASDKQCTI